MNRNCFEKNRIIAILRELNEVQCIETSKCLFSGGIRVMEVTFNQQKSDSFFETASRIYEIKKELGQEVVIGAGTVITKEQVDLAFRAGASYIVTPTVQMPVIQKAKELGMCCIPGAYTPTEIATAYELGADIVKVFPASTLGEEYFKALKGPLGHIPLAAVGGIHLKNMKNFIRAGAVAVGIGSSLVDKRMIQKCDWEALEKLARTYKRCAED